MPTSDLGRFDPFDVVIVPFPCSDRLAEKRRPAVVISNRKLSTLGLTWLAMITSAENPSWPGDVQISDLKVSGLPAPSTMRPAKTACIESSRILRRAGKLDRATARMVSQHIRGLLG
jgi:mRNA interferase MazF